MAQKGYTSRSSEVCYSIGLSATTEKKKTAGDKVLKYELLTKSECWL